MHHIRRSFARRASLRLLAGLVLVCGSVGTEAATGGASVNPADLLARSVRAIVTKPLSVSTLVTAGDAALKVGDVPAAAGFFGRADELDSTNAATKAGLGATLVALGRPGDSLFYFAMARRLGASQADIGCQRGLAFDLLGDHDAAQADYAAALSGADADEARRRLALSLAVSGGRDAALAMLDPLAKRQDPSADRVRALILAMTGDAAGAGELVAHAMPAVARRMAPFLERLSSLTASQKVAAANLGIFPSHSGDGLDFKANGQIAAAQGVREAAESVPTSPSAMQYGGMVSKTPRQVSSNGSRGPDLTLFGVFQQ